jgi:hypothetical protein
MKKVLSVLAGLILLPSIGFGQMTTVVTPIVKGSSVDRASKVGMHFQIQTGSTKLPFVLSVGDTSLNLMAGDITQIDGTLQNLSDSILTITCTRTQVLPDNWSTSICFGTVCQPPMVSVAKSVFQPHEKDIFSFHVNTDESTPMGTLTARLTISASTGNPADTSSIVVTATSHTAGVATQQAKSLVLNTAEITSIFPSPLTSGESLNLQVSSPNSGIASFSIYDALGRRLSVALPNQQISRGLTNLTLPSLELPTGSYMLRMELNGSALQGRMFQLVH